MTMYLTRCEHAVMTQALPGICLVDSDICILDRDIILDFSVFSHLLVVSASATDCLDRLVSEMTYIVSSGTLNYYYYYGS